MVRYAWSAPLWESFHYLSANCKDNINEINKVKTIIIKFIYIIPCITCKTHAINYMKAKPFNTIDTKKKMRIYMFVFHNYVKTIRVHQSPAPINILKKYEKSNKTILATKINNGIRLCKKGTESLPRQTNLFLRRSKAIAQIFNTMVF
jgi:hypothetical protein